MVASPFPEWQPHIDVWLAPIDMLILFRAWWERYRAGLEATDGPVIPGNCTRCSLAGDTFIERYCGDCTADSPGAFI